MGSRAPGNYTADGRCGPLVDGVRIERSTHGLRITRAWARAAGYGMLLWVAVWLGMVGFFTSLGTRQDGGLVLLLALPAIGMAYAALTRFLNRTVIDVTPTAITVHHAPLPWPGRRRLATRDVKALHLEVRRIRARPPYDECWILAERSGGRKTMLLKGLEMSALQTDGIAAILSGHLGVPVHADTR